MNRQDLHRGALLLQEKGYYWQRFQKFPLFKTKNTLYSQHLTKKSLFKTHPKKKKTQQTLENFPRLLIGKI
jgi:hypothetical protein